MKNLIIHSEGVPHTNLNRGRKITFLLIFQLSLGSHFSIALLDEKGYTNHHHCAIEKREREKLN